MKLNLGCGNNRIDDCVNLDIDPNVNPDVLGNFDTVLPFADKTFERVIAKHILEHTEDLVFTMKEIHRVLEDDGILELSVPIFPCVASIADPTHKRYIVEETILMFCSPEFTIGSNFPGRDMFDVVEIKKKQHDVGHSAYAYGEFLTELKATLRKKER